MRDHKDFIATIKKKDERINQLKEEVAGKFPRLRELEQEKLDKEHVIARIKLEFDEQLKIETRKLEDKYKKVEEAAVDV